MKSGFFISCKENDMYFVTDEPRLFNIKNGIIIQLTYSLVEQYDYEVRIKGNPVLYGTRKECEDFIYSLAGWVGAVNPMAKAGSNG